MTEEQVAEIRRSLADRPELQEALRTELSTEQSPAGKAPRRPTNFEEVIALIRTLAETGQPTRRSIWPVAVLFVIAAAIGVVLTVRPRLDQPPPPSPIAPTSQPDQRRAATRSTDRHATTAPATRPARNPVKPDDPKKPKTRAPQTRPVDPADGALPASFPLAWQDYALETPGEESDWRSQLPKLFVRTGGAKEPKPSGNRKLNFVELDGTYSLGVLPGRERLLRLGIASAKKCQLEFRGADNVVRIRIQPKKRIAIASFALQDLKSDPTPKDSGDDHYQWRSDSFHTWDIRYQDGRIMICRGEVPVLSAVMPKPPVEGKLDCSGLRVRLAEVRRVPPLALPDDTVDQTSTRKTTAAAFEWKLDPSDTKIEEVELLADKTGGKVSLLNKADKVPARASFAVGVAPSAGVEVTLHVTEFCPSAIFSVSSELGGGSIGLKSRGDRYVPHAGDKKKRKAIGNRQTVGKAFWIRARVGGDSWTIWISPDSRRWWLGQSGQGANLPKRIEFAMEIPPAKGKERKVIPRATIGAVTVRRFEAFTRLTDPKLVARASQALTAEMLGSASRSEILASVAKSADKNALPRAWAMACDTALVSRALQWTVRREALGELLAEAIARSSDTDVPKILVAIGELSEIGGTASGLAPIQHKALEALGRICVDNSRYEAVERIVNASYMSLIGGPRSPVLSPGLFRLYLLNLISRDEWKSVRREAMRAIYHSDPAVPQNASTLAFARWALSDANTRLADKSDSKAMETEAAPKLPLVVNDDRALLNTLGEFLVLIGDKHYEPACKSITGRTLPDSLVCLDKDEDLLQSSHVRIRKVIGATPELRKILERDHSEIGLIRLERARKRNDLAALKSIAAQFYGTAPGFEAMHVLADRNLSNGNFRGAAAGYKLLQAQDGYERRKDAAAKFRLTSAMLGKLLGKPVDQPVALPGGTFSPQEFEQMVKRLAADRKSAPVTGKAPAGPEPRGRVAKLTYLASVPGKPVGGQKAVRPSVFIFSADAQRLVVGFVDRLFAVDRNSRKVLWPREGDSQQPAGKIAGVLAARPLQIGNRLFLRNGLTGRPLTCIDTGTGKFLWSRRYDEDLLSDPVMIGSWVSVITARRGTSTGLQLHRVSPETGESSVSSELVRVRDKRPVIGRPAVVGDSILFRVRGCLINCDISGAIRWARRLRFVPPQALPDLHKDTALDDIVVRDGNVIFSLPGCPYITCVSAESGEVLWSFTIHPPARLLGLHGGSVIVSEPDRTCALDADTGKLRWQQRYSGRQAAVLPAGGDTLVSVHLDKPPGQPKKGALIGRYVRWISCKDGRTVKEIPVEGETSLHDVLQISGDGKLIFGLAGHTAAKQGLPGVFTIEIQD